MNPRGYFWLGALSLSVLFMQPASATDVRSPLAYDRMLLPGERPDVAIGSRMQAARAETTWFGLYEVIDGEFYAIPGSTKEEVAWTFDHGIGPEGVPGRIDGGEGWEEADAAAQDGVFFRVIDDSLDLGEGVPPPILSGERSLWVGMDAPGARSSCWECAAGYGNAWLQRATSPLLAYDGSGDVALRFLYFQNSEPCFDGTQVYLAREDGSWLLLNPTLACPTNPEFEGGFTDGIGNPVTPALYERTISAAEIGGAQSIQLVIEFTSDGGWSDEDGDYCTTYGPFGMDDVAIQGSGIDAFYDFETGLQGWVPSIPPPHTGIAGIAPIDCYTILDPCACRLENNILEMHEGECDDGYHPDGQHTEIRGPICELAADPPLKVIGIDFDMYADGSQESGVLIRPGAMYYPYTCPSTGEVGWSGRVGQEAHYYPSEPTCATSRFLFTDLSNYGGGEPVPPDAQKIRPIIEVLLGCESFAIEPCGGTFPPLFDNIAVWATAGVAAPTIAFDFLTQFQDNGSFPSDLFDVRAAVPANITRDNHGESIPGETRDLLGDSLVITGPLPSLDPNTRWEARMWWRVAKRGPFQADRENGADTRYKIWKDRVSDGLQIDRPYRAQFTFGWMDSVQLGSFPVRNKFKSDFRENDDDFVGEFTADNEMIWDDALRPGTQIEYFVTSNYVLTPSTLFYFPDTTGGNFFEFEGLPGIRTANVANCGGAGFNYCVFQPATLYVDAYNLGGSQRVIENALRTVLNGRDPCLEEDGCAIPQDRNWDRYDYFGAGSNFKASIGRGTVPGSNNGFTVNQVLGYRAIIVNTGTLGSGCMDDGDFAFFDSWLTSAACPGALNRQVFIMNGDKTGQLMESPGGDHTFGPEFMQNVLGATLLCDSFNGIGTADPDCEPENTSYCVRLLPVAGGPFGTLTDVDAFGNFCPNLYTFNAFAPNGTGVGNRTYSAEDPPKILSFAQMTNQNLAVPNYRAVLDGVSYHHMTRRNAGGQGESLCPRDFPPIVEGVVSEIRAALRWGFGVADDAEIPKLTSAEELSTCQGTWSMPADVGDQAAVRVNRLYPNEPNPFNPRTTIRFSLAQPGEVQLLVFDVNGRLVRTLVDGKRDAGLHTVVWDGTNDENHKVGSGIYWSQMEADSYVSSKKMVVLK